MTETKYTEIFKLKEMLEQANIPFEFTDRSFPISHGGKLESYQIEYPVSYHNGERVCSVIEGYGTYGNRENLLEIMGLLTHNEEREGKVKGWLSAEEVFERIKHHYDNNPK